MPSLKLEDFKKNIADFNRPNRFIVQFIVPFLNNSNDSISYTVSGTKIPNYKINPIPVKFMSQTVNYRGTATFQPVDITFYDDINNTAKSLVINWMNYIKSFNSPYAANKTNNYLNAQVILTRYDIMNNVNATYTFNNAILLEMQEVDLSMDKKSEISQFTVQLGYSYYNISLNNNNIQGVSNSMGIPGLSSGGVLNSIESFAGSTLSGVLGNVLSGVQSGISGDLQSIVADVATGQGFSISGMVSGLKGNLTNSLQSDVQGAISSGLSGLGGLL